MRRKRIKRYEKEKKAAKKKRTLLTIITLWIVIILYFVPTFYFTQHFNYGTSINNIDVSFKKAQQVNGMLLQDIEQYQLTINGPNNQSETLSASQMGLSFDLINGYQELKETQHSFLWFMPLFSNKKDKLERLVQCDEEVLKKSIDQLKLLKTLKKRPAVDAKIKYINGQYEILPETQGVAFDKEEVYQQIREAICRQQHQIDLNLEECMVEPEFTENSKELLSLKQTLNHCIHAKIIYPTPTGDLIIDKELIHKWLSIDDNLTVSIDETAMMSYLKSIEGAIKITTIEFVTTAGNSINLKKGRFNSQLNIEQETKRLIDDINRGNITTRQPAAMGIGDTYVEIDLTSQHLWLIKEGKCLIDGDIVTGNVQAGHKTPPGLFNIYAKGKNVVLRGDNYASPVTYWMPFNGGIGIHDANWRSEFGGTIYKTHGSHGCINCPYDLAKTIYTEVDVGTPVVCYN